ncbi:MAG TPA: 6-phosphogluconolactonase [Vicinamibacterales bacterium]|jgi:6-phosphogluconolactonase
MMRIQVSGSANDLSQAAAEEFTRVTGEAVTLRGRCAVALAGGSTPRGLYQALAHSASLRARVPWAHIDVFWGDERCVPPDHPDSNYRMAHETLLSSVPIAPDHIHRIAGELDDASVAARMYEAAILATLSPGEPMPRFDLILLGLGTDGHTASLFPGTPALAERERLCVDNWVPATGVRRITLTLPLINAARTVMFVVSGPDKAAIVQAVQQRRGSERAFPAQFVQPDGELLWMLDRDAARLLGATSS